MQRYRFEKKIPFRKLLAFIVIVLFAISATHLVFFTNSVAASPNNDETEEPLIQTQTFTPTTPEVENNQKIDSETTNEGSKGKPPSMCPTYDFYGVGSLATTDGVGVDTVDYGLWQNCNRNLVTTQGWAEGGGIGNSHANVTTVYEGNASLGLYIAPVLGSRTRWVQKYPLNVTESFDPTNMWISFAVYDENLANEYAQGVYIRCIAYDSEYFVGEAQYWLTQYAMEDWDAPKVDRVIIGDQENQWYYVSRNVTAELEDSGGAQLTQAQIESIVQLNIIVRHQGSLPYEVPEYAFFDALQIIGHDNANFPEPTFEAGDPTVFYSPSGLNITCDSDDKAYVRCDYDDLTDVDDYKLKVVYSDSPSGSPMISSNLTVSGTDELWNRTFSQMGNDTWVSYRDVESYFGRNIDSYYLDIRCDEDESVAYIWSVSYGTDDWAIYNIVLLVWDAASPEANETLLADHIADLGHNVTIIDFGDSDMDYTGYHAIIVGYSCLTVGSLLVNLKEKAIPILVMSSYAVKYMELGDYGTSYPEGLMNNKTTIVDVNHYISRVSTPASSPYNVTMYTEPEKVFECIHGWTNDVHRIAFPPGGYSYIEGMAVIAKVDEGGQLEDGTYSLARRVFFGYWDVTHWSEEGRLLFNRALGWCLYEDNKTYDFYGVAKQTTEDYDGIGSVSGVWQDCGNDLVSTEDWTEGGGIGYYGNHVNTTIIYEGNASFSVTIDPIAATTTSWIQKQFTVGGSSFDPRNIWVSFAMQSGNLSGSAPTGYYSTFLRVTVGNDSGTFGHVEFWLKAVSVSNAPSYDCIWVGDTANIWYYISHNVTKELEDSGGAVLSLAEIDDITFIKITFQLGKNSESAKKQYAYLDALQFIGHDDANFPQPTFEAGDPKIFYNPDTGLNITSDSDDRVYVTLDYDDFLAETNYEVYAIYQNVSGDANATISSSLDIDEAGWATWNQTIPTLPNKTWGVYGTATNVTGRYVDIRCNESESINILSLTYRIPGDPDSYTEPLTISLVSPANESTIGHGATIDLDIICDISVTALYNWDGGSNSSLESPYDVTMAFSSGTHILNVYAETEGGSSDSKLYVFTGAPTGGGTPGEGGGGVVSPPEEKKMIVVVDYDLVIHADDSLKVVVSTTDTLGNPITGAYVEVGWKDGKRFVMMESTEKKGEYEYTFQPNMFSVGDYELEVFARKDDYKDFSHSYALRVVESGKVIAPVTRFLAIFSQFPAILVQNVQFILAAVGAGIFAIVLFYKRDVLQEILGLGLPAPKKLRAPPELRLPKKPSFEIGPAVAPALQGKARHWLLFASISVGMTIWMLSSIYRGMVGGSTLWFYSFLIIFPFIVIIAYDIYGLGEKGEEEPHLLFGTSGDFVKAIMLGFIITVVCSRLIYIVIIAVAEYTPIAMWAMPLQLTDDVETIWTQILVGTGENLGILVLISIIMDLLGFEDKKWQMFVSCGVFATFHWWAASVVAPQLSFLFLWFYFFAGGISLFLVIYGGAEMEIPLLEKFPRGGLVASVIVHAGVNLLVVLGGIIVIV